MSHKGIGYEPQGFGYEAQGVVYEPRVASPPSVAAEAPPQVVSKGADVGDAP